MTRSELVDLLAERSRQLTRRDAEAVVTIVLGAMGDALARGNRVEIRGFGSFAINRRPARIGHNPRTGQPIQISELRVPHFKPGKELRDAVARLAHTDPDQAQP